MVNTKLFRMQNINKEIETMKNQKAKNRLGISKEHLGGVPERQNRHKGNNEIIIAYFYLWKGWSSYIKPILPFY